MLSSKNKIKKMILLLVALFGSALMFAVFFPLLMTYYTPMDSKTYDYSVDAPDGQVVTDTKGWEVFLNEKGKITPLVFDNIGGFTGLSYDGQTFYYSRVLDEVRDDPMLQIEVVNRSVSIFLDDELLYTDWPELDNRIGYLELPMQEWDRADPVLVSLPTDYAGKTLTIAQSTSPLGSEKQESTNTAVYLCSVRLYCGYAYESNLISQSAQTAYPAIILFLLGISLLCLMVYQSFHGHTDFGLFFFAGVLFLNMCSILINAPFFYKYFPLNGQPMIDYKTHAALFGVTCLLLFISTRIRGNARWILTFLAFLQGVSVGLGVACQIYFPNQPTLLYLDDFLSLIAILVTLFFAVCQSRRGISFFTSFCKAAFALSTAYLVFLIVSVWFYPDYWAHFKERIPKISPSNVAMPLRALRIMAIICSLWAILVDFLKAQAEKASQQTALRLQEEMARDTYEHIRSQAEETAIMRHDLQKHLNTLGGLLAGGQIARAKNYIAEVTEKAKQIPKILNTGNYILDITLNSRLSEALERGIQVDIIRADAPPSLPMKDTDLSSILLNALDNAIRACNDSSNKNPWIRLDLHTKKQFFYLSLENSTPEPGDQNNESKKLNMVKEHGYGILIMERTAEKYGGLMQIKRLPGRFRISFALPAEPPEDQLDT